MEVDLSEVTVCAPCDQGAAHPESHAAETLWLLADRVLASVPDERAVLPLVHAVRAVKGVSGPITVHKSPASDLNTATFGEAHEWIATQP